MEKGKGSRGHKAKNMQFPGDFIALGSKSAAGRQQQGDAAADSKRTGAPGVVHKSALTIDRKREAAAVQSIPAKKSKMLVSGLMPLGRSDSTSSTAGAASSSKVDPQEEAWELVAVEVPSQDLYDALGDADDHEDMGRIEALICGTVKQLKSQRGKPDPVLYMTLICTAKSQPLYFCTNHVVEAFCSLLKRDSSLSFKTKGNVLGPVLAANVLMAAYADEKSWPEIFIKVYIEDAVGERLWVDHEDCKGFVDNICTAFVTRLPPKSLLYPELGLGRSECPSPPVGTSGDMEVVDLTGAESGDSKDKASIVVEMRYAGLQEEAEKMVMDVVKEQLSRRQHTDNITRNFLRLLTSTCGLSEVRTMVVQRLEIWLQNPKLTRPAQELLMSLCMNCNTRLQSDVDVVSHLVKIRLKTKPLIQLYLNCIRELISIHHPDNLAAVIKHTIYNELSVNRNQNNMAMLGVMFQHSPDLAATTLADVCVELLMRKEDFLYATRALLREIVRALRHEINLKVFCAGLTRDRTDNTQFREFEHKERMFLAIGDLLTVCIFLAISPSVKEAGALAARGDKKEIGILQTFQKLVANIQQEAVHWLHVVALRMYRPGRREFIHNLHKVLFREQPEVYFNKDPWPPENERQLMLRLASEVPVLQNTLVQLFIIGLSKNHPLSAPDALELGDQLIKRAATLCSEGFPVLMADKMDLIDLIFNLCTYHHPENITLPTGYQPPKLAITNLYWKAWIMLLILSAHNPYTFGSVAWENYSTLRAFMEMCITNHFNFPPPTMASREQVEELRSKELQLAAVEKQEILGFEGHLAAASTQATITEQTSLLLSQLTTLDPVGIARKPPPGILDQLKALNSTLKLGHLLCRSRSPDFLLDIIQRQGTSQSMPWLADLVESSEGSFSLLPVQCLCEFLMNEDMQAALENEELQIAAGGTAAGGKAAEKNIRLQEKQRKQQQLVSHLQGMLRDASQDPQICADVLDYFLRRLSSEQMSSRIQAVRGLKAVLGPSGVVQGPTQDEETELLDTSTEGEEPPGVGVGQQTQHPQQSQHPHAWLLTYLPLLPHFSVICGQVIHSLRNACQVEHDPQAVGAYIQFLARHAINDPIQDLSDLVLDMAQLIVERSTLTSAILPSVDSSKNEPAAIETLQSFLGIFVLYMQKAREPSREAVTWSENQDQIRVHWSTGEEATMHILVVHAMVILLTYGPIGDPSLSNQLLEMWFPTHQEAPKAFLVDTADEALLFYDWLKLRMIRSNVLVLVDAALRDLEPAQLVLFIQSFGIPVSSMSQLLHTLDQAVETNHVAVSEEVMDKTYMAQLVEVQWKRGASGGQRFVDMLQLQETKPLLSEKAAEETSSKSSLPAHSIKMEVCKKEEESLSVFQVEELVGNIFDQGAPDKYGALRTLQMALHREMVGNKQKERPVLSACLRVTEVTMDQDQAGFAKRVVKMPNFASAFFRMLIAGCNSVEMKDSMEMTRMLELSRKLLLLPNMTTSPVFRMLKKFSIQFQPKKHSPVPQIESATDMAEDLQSTALLRLERRGWKVIEEGMSSNQSGRLVEGVCHLLLDNHSSSSPPELVSRTGLYIDWLEVLDPEMIRCCPSTQMGLLFSRRRDASFRPYLLSLLTHRASWNALDTCITNLLRECNKEFDPTSVLDVLSNCTTNQKLWQGRDKYIPKHRSPEDVLCLDSSRLVFLAEYILEEASILDDGSPAGRRSALEAMETRTRLLLRCCQERLEPLEEVVDRMAALWKSGENKEMAVQLLLQLYLQVPRVLSRVAGRDAFLKEARWTESSGCFLDFMLHAILSLLTTTQPGKEWGHRMKEVDMVARKMAASHPILFLRHLPMMAISLHGRVHLDYGIFRSRNHLNLFSYVLGLVELLQPHIFWLQYGEALEETLNSYMDLYRHHAYHNDRHHSYPTDLGVLLSRLVGVLQNYVSHDPTRALAFVRRNGDILTRLLRVYPEMPSLRALVSGAVVPKTDGDSDPSLPPVVLTASALSAPHPDEWMHQQTAPLYTKLCRSGSNPEDVMAVLQELDSMSKMRPSVLLPFAGSLKKLVSHWGESVRSTAFSLLMRHLLHCPGEAGQYVDTFMRCLDSQDASLVDIALAKLPDFAILAQEDATMLLQKAFTLGVYGSLSTCPLIIRTLLLLNMQNGY